MKKQIVWVTFLIMGLFVSAFFIVYMKDVNRRLFIQYQHLQREKAQVTMQWRELLLEQSTWLTQSRITHIAHNQLGMETPSIKEVSLIALSPQVEKLRFVAAASLR